jgi:hypothetical protein
MKLRFDRKSLRTNLNLRTKDKNLIPKSAEIYLFYCKGQNY